MARSARRRTANRRWSRHVRRLHAGCIRLTARIVSATAWCAHRRDVPLTVLLVGTCRSPRRLRRQVRQAARVYAAALGAPLPPHTTIVLSPALVALDRARPLAGLLEVFATLGDHQRAVLHLAFDPEADGRPAEAEVLAALRIQVSRLLEPVTGAALHSVPIPMRGPASTTPGASAPIIPLPARGGPPVNGALPWDPGSDGRPPRPRWWSDEPDHPA